MNIFLRSWQGLNLSPGERAFLKLFEGWLATAIGAGIAIAYQLLATGSQDFQKIELVAGGAAALSLINAIKKYMAAQTDVPLPVASLATQAADLAIQEVQKITPPPAPAPVPAPPVPQFKTPIPLANTTATVPPPPLTIGVPDMITNVMPAIPMPNGRDWTGLEIPVVQP